MAAVRSLQDSALTMPDPAERGALLRRLDQDRSYISFGVWRRPDDAVAWRSSEGFGKAFTRLLELSDDVVAGPCEVIFEA